ncbi:MAG: FecR domain-containing protein [Sandaracinaceae bacterium]|nr:FecR domain-containing protein [Sandaracinaceae bacterium]
MSELDRLLDAARDAAPAALDDGATDALVAEARRRSAAPRGAALDGLLASAQGAEPDALTERELRALVQHAAVTGGARHRRWTLWRVSGVAALAAMGAAAAVTLAVLDPGEAPAPVAERGASEPAPPASPLEPREERAPSDAVEPTGLDLPTGDRLMAASGARFDVALEEPRVRRVRLGGGSMLFDVRRIERGRFHVTTPNAEVEVLGTVFSVRAAEGATTVWVYEGAVRVRGEGRARVVEAGEVAHLGAGEIGEDALADEGREAAAARRAPGPIASAEDGDEAGPEVARREPLALAPSPEAARGPRGERSREATAPEQAPEQAPEPALEAIPAPTPTSARALIARGGAADALALASEALAQGRGEAWRMVEADALRALGRLEDAAEAYGRAAQALPAPRRQQAGFLEARLRAGELGDPAGALRALRAAGVAAPRSVLRERGLALEVQLLSRLGRREEAASVAAEYVRAFPDGADADAMRAYAGQ